MKWVIKVSYVDTYHFLDNPYVEFELEYYERSEAVQNFRKMKETEYRLYKAGKKWNRYHEISLYHGKKMIYVHHFRYEREKRLWVD